MSPTAPIITVLMPVYNGEGYLQEAIDSILNQSFKEFEFLIIDDGSTDSSVQIIRAYQDPRIRLVQNERNLGISATLNRGIELCNTELIARMDADDISYPDRLQKQVTYMLAHDDCGLLSTWARVITHDGRPVRLEKYNHRFYYYNLNFECWIYHPTVVLRKTAVVSAGMYSKPYSEDYDLFWKIARDHRIDNIDEALLDYRLSPTSLNTVLKKSEYDLANRENVMRNLRYYMGDDFDLRDEYLECLRHNFSPIVALNHVECWLECLKILKNITTAISTHPNVNRNPKDIENAAFHKKDFMVEQIFFQSSGFQKFKLIFKAKKPNIFFRKIEKSLRWRFNSAKRHLRSINNR